MNHKIVYAFTAYSDAELLERKIRFLYTEEDFFIVHWNRYSSKKKLHQIRKAFQDCPNVYIYSKLKVVWGTYTILLAMLENMKLALTLTGGGAVSTLYFALRAMCTCKDKRIYQEASDKI